VALRLDILPQPDDTSCGPTCLQAIYRFHGDELALAKVMKEVDRLPNGGTLAVLLGCHALRRGYRATLYTYNLQLWDPTWFSEQDGWGDADVLSAKLIAQREEKKDAKLRMATRANLDFLALGGRIGQPELSPALIRKLLQDGHPVLAGLSATYLYRSAREHGREHATDDVRGDPMGHFVVLSGYRSRYRQVLVADPLHPNPPFLSRHYAVEVDRLVGAIALGIWTYDANLLVIEPSPKKRGRSMPGGSASAVNGETSAGLAGRAPRARRSAGPRENRA
jgi:Peptidase_C39 like family